VSQLYPVHLGERDKYHVVEYPQGYSGLIRPDGSEVTSLTEPEDIHWHRELKPIHDELNNLHQQLATITQERDALKRIIDDTLREVPVGNVNAHIPENLPMDMEYYVQETVKQDFEIERLEKERDALKSQWAIMARACGNWREWPECTVSESAPDYTHSDWQAAARAILERNALHEVVRALISAGDALYIKGKFADPDYWAPCNWATVVEESAKLLTPSAEAGKGGGV